MSGVTRGESVTLHDGTAVLLLDRGPKAGTWWAMPSGARRAVVVRWYPKRGAWLEVTE